MRDKLAEKGEKLLNELVAKAEGGDTDALKFLLSRLLPPARDVPETVKASGNSLGALSESIVREAVDGRITAATARELTGALSNAVRIHEIEELRARLETLERIYAARNQTN